MSKRTDYEINNLLYNFKQRLYLKVKEYLDIKERYKNSKVRIEILKNLLEMLEEEENLKDNIAGIGITMEICLSKEISDKFIDTLFELTNNTYYLTKDEENFSAEKVEFLNKYKRILIYAQRLLNLEVIQNRKDHKFLETHKDEIISYKKIQSSLKYNNYIEQREIDSLKKFFDEEDLPTRKQIAIYELINEHNIKLNNNGIRVSKKSLDILLDKYNKFNIDYKYDYVENLDKKIISYISLIDDDNYEENIKLLPKIDDEYMSIEEFDYIYRTMLNKYIDKIEECRKNLEENYFDIEIRKVILLEYQDIKNRYYRILSKYSEEQERYNKKEAVKEEIKEIEEDKEKEPIRNLLYTRRNEQFTYIESDLKDIPEEYYDRTENLLKNFKDGTLSVDKIRALASNSKFKGFRELKEDQVRIVFKEIGNNNYLILGASVKKVDSDSLMLSKLVNRYRKLTDEEIEILKNNAKSDEEKIFKKLDDDKRKGSR